MAEAVTSHRKLPKLIVVVAFDKDDEGTPQAVYGPAEQQSEERVVRTATSLAVKHYGVIAWSREADITLGEYGPPTILFQAGEVPEME